MRQLALVLMTFVVGCARREFFPDFVEIPSGQAIVGDPVDPSQREETFGSFAMSRHEITVQEWVEFLNDAGASDWPLSPQVLKRRNGYRPARGAARMPVGWISYHDAQSYCRWLSRRRACSARLPTESEWEYAARGGIVGARYPWGWGSWTQRACFAADGPKRVGSYRANGYGLHDMAGNVFEWCQASEATNLAPVRGGSWSERDPKRLRVYARLHLPASYRGPDVGFRVLIEKNEQP